MRNYKPIMLAGLLLVLGGCASNRVKQVDAGLFQKFGKQKVTACLYTKTGLKISLMGFPVGVAGGAVGAAAVGLSNPPVPGSKNGAFEQEKLGDFSVLNCFDSTFRGSAGQASYFQFAFADSLNTTEKIISRFADNFREFEPEISGEHQKNGARYICALKLQYGIRMRRNGENFGFVKTYRPYLLLKGAIRNAKTDELVWENQLIVFSHSISYSGRKEVVAAYGPVLRGAYIGLCQQLTTKLINSLNGQKVVNEDVFPDKNGEDLRF